MYICSSVCDMAFLLALSFSSSCRVLAWTAVPETTCSSVCRPLARSVECWTVVPETQVQTPTEAEKCSWYTLNTPNHLTYIVPIWTPAVVWTSHCMSVWTLCSISFIIFGGFYLQVAMDPLLLGLFESIHTNMNSDCHLNIAMRVRLNDYMTISFIIFIGFYLQVAMDPFI